MEKKEDDDRIKPFAITARKFGVADCIYTKIIVVNVIGDNLLGTYVNALWDTGSPKCLMTKTLADFLHIEPLVMSTIKGLGGITEAGGQMANINIVANGDVIPVECWIVKEIPGDKCSFLLGMNFISMGSLSLSFDGKQTVFSFIVPPVTPIDYIDQADKSHTTDYQLLSYGKENLELISNHKLSMMIYGKKK